MKKTYSAKVIQELINKANEYGLEGADLLEAYSIKELQGIYNGIGPDRFSEEFRNIMTRINHTPLPAVLIHDIRFFEGGNRKSFHYANRELFKNLRKITMIAYKWWNPMRWIQWIRSWYFYELCEDIGFEGWNFFEEDN